MKIGTVLDLRFRAFKMLWLDASVLGSQLPWTEEILKVSSIYTNIGIDTSRSCFSSFPLQA